MHRYRLHDTAGDDLGLIEHPAPNVEPGDVMALAGGRERLLPHAAYTGRGAVGY